MHENAIFSPITGGGGSIRRVRPMLDPPLMLIKDVYGIRHSLIGVGSITEVKQRRARFIIGWVAAWDCQVLYTLGHVQRSDVMSWGSENHINQMAHLTELELDVIEPQWT